MAEMDCRTITRVTKIFTFDAAHILEHHSGKCSNLHGHTYRLEVTVQGVARPADGLSSEGMVIDFGDLKKLVQQVVLDRVDHAMLNDIDEFYVTTAEVMAKVIFKWLNYALETFYEHADLVDWTQLAMDFTKNADPELPPEPVKLLSRPRLHSVRLWETPTSFAEVIRV